MTYIYRTKLHLIHLFTQNIILLKLIQDIRFDIFHIIYNLLNILLLK